MSAAPVGFSPATLVRAFRHYGIEARVEGSEIIAKKGDIEWSCWFEGDFVDGWSIREACLRFALDQSNFSIKGYEMSRNQA